MSQRMVLLLNKRTKVFVDTNYKDTDILSVCINPEEILKDKSILCFLRKYFPFIWGHYLAVKEIRKKQPNFPMHEQFVTLMGWRECDIHDFDSLIELFKKEGIEVKEIERGPIEEDVATSES